MLKRNAWPGSGDSRQLSRDTSPRQRRIRHQGQTFAREVDDAQNSEVTSIGNPNLDHVSTSYVERQNLTMRMSMKRFGRLTNAHSKKLINHRHALSLHFCFYNWTRIHKTLRITPAMAAGLTDRLWTMEEIIEMMDAVAPKPGRPKTYKKRADA